MRNVPDGKPLVQWSHDFAPTNVSGPLSSSLVIQHNEEARIEGCYINKFKGDKMKKGYKRRFNVMVVNLAYIDP